MDSQSRCVVNRFWTLLSVLVAVAALVYGCGRIAAHAADRTAHDSRVTAKCWPAPANTKGVEVIVYNGKDTATGRFTGWRITATYRDGGSESRDVRSFPSPMRLAPFAESGGITWFDPHHISGCTARILWVNQAG